MNSDQLNHNVFKNSLEEFAKEKGEKINTLGMLSVLRADSTIIVAPLRSFDTSPATDLKKGVDSAYAFINSPERAIPAGFYTLRVSAETVQVGEVPGTLEYVDAHGKTVKRSAIQLDIKSLTVPQPPAFPHSVASVTSKDAHDGGLTPAIQTDPIIVCCPNGYCWFERP